TLSGSGHVGFVCASVAAARAWQNLAIDPGPRTLGDLLDRGWITRVASIRSNKNCNRSRLIPAWSWAKSALGARIPPFAQVPPPATAYRSDHDRPGKLPPSRLGKIISIPLAYETAL